MGGRGVTSPSFIPGFGNWKEKEFQSGILGLAIPDNLKGAVGEKGKPLSMKQAYSGANPYFSHDFREYSENCQRVVVAYELRRRGYKVTALPTYKGDSLPYRTKGDNGRWMGAFQHAKTIDVGASRRSKAILNLESKMKEWGSGSRAVVRVTWNGKNGYGHVFNVENHNGKMYYIDSQIGKRVSINNYMSFARPKELRLIRTDNLRISNRAKKSVTPERGLK